MIPKEKAKEMAINIYEKHYYCDFLNDDISVTKHSIITIDLILCEYSLHDTERRDFWKQVKKEIKKVKL